MTPAGAIPVDDAPRLLGIIDRVGGKQPPMDRLVAPLRRGARVRLDDFDQAQPDACRQRAVALLLRTADFDLPVTQFDDHVAPGLAGIARRQGEAPRAGGCERGGGGIQPAAIGQRAVAGRADQQMAVVGGPSRPQRIHVRLAVGDDGYHRRLCQHHAGLARAVQPVQRFAVVQRPLLVRHRIDAGTVPHRAADQAKTGMTVGIDRQHRVHHQPVDIALFHRAEAATPRRRGRKPDMAGILDRQHMTPGAGRRGALRPTGNDLLRRHLWVGEKPAGPQLRAPTLTQPTQAERLAHHHSFEQFAPFYRDEHPRRSPETMSSSTPCLFRSNTANCNRSASRNNKSITRTLQSRYYLCACPSAKAGMTGLAGMTRLGFRGQCPI